MKFKEKLDRWMLLMFPPRSVEQRTRRRLSQLWKQLRKEEPRWYEPVGDALTPAFCQAVLGLRQQADLAAGAIGLAECRSVPPSRMVEIVQSLTDSYLERSNCLREQLTLENILHDLGSEAEGDFHRIGQTLHKRVHEVLKGDTSRWEAGLPHLEALVHLVCFDWTPLAGFAGKDEARRPPCRGVGFVDALEDLTYVLEPLSVSASLEFLWGVLAVNGDPAPLAALGRARKQFMEGGRLLDVIRAIRSDPDHQFRRAVYAPPTITEVIKGLAQDFETALQVKKAEYEDAKLHKYLIATFGKRPLEEVPGYNQTTNQVLIDRKLPELGQLGAMQALHNFIRYFDAEPIKRFWREFPLHVDFVTIAAKEEFNSCQDNYDRFLAGMEKFQEDMLSPSFSPIEAVLHVLDQPIIPDSRTKTELRKHIEATNRWAEQLCQSGASSIRDTLRLFARLQIDIDAQTPTIYTGGSILQEKHPGIVADLKDCLGILQSMDGILRCYVVDMAEAKQRLSG